MALLRNYPNGGFSAFAEPDPPQEDPGINPPGTVPWEVYNPPAPTTTVPTPGGPKGGGGGGVSGFGDLGGRPTFNFGNVPEFTPPDFKVPTWQEVQANDPGYQFRLKGGTDALERSAAARGTLRTGGTLKDIVDYGQNYSTQEYGNAFNRAKDAYQLQYQGSKDKYAPHLAQWQTQAQAEMAAALAQYNRQFDLYSFNNRGGGGPAPIPPPPDRPDVSNFSTLNQKNYGF